MVSSWYARGHANPCIYRQVRYTKKGPPFTQSEVHQEELQRLVQAAGAEQEVLGLHIPMNAPANGRRWE